MSSICVTLNRRSDKSLVILYLTFHLNKELLSYFVYCSFVQYAPSLYLETVAYHLCSHFLPSLGQNRTSPKCVCPFSTKTVENSWQFLCTGKAWLIVVTWHQKVQMTKNWTCHLCALNSRYDKINLKKLKSNFLHQDCANWEKAGCRLLKKWLLSF